MRAVCHRKEEIYPIAVEHFCLAVELPVCECCVTATFSDIFEANGLSIDDIVRCKSYKPLPSGGRR